MASPRDCPTPEYWQALLANTLPQAERQGYEQHLESCPACQHYLDQAREQGGTLQRLGQQLGDPTVVPRDPSLTRFLERLHQSRSPDRAARAEPVDLYFLRPAERPGLLGMLGSYEVEEVIGQGGFSVVLKAFEPALHRHVAIKVLSPAVAGSATARRRFTREAQAAAAVSHDHVVAVHGVDETEGLPYLVMQYVAGESLQGRLDRNGPLELTEIVRIGMQTAQGLAAAHAQGLIHRDIKPANLLLENGLARVKITDFGLARLVDDTGLTQNGTLAGTPEYMAPEQSRGEPLDARADLFSLGSVLYACCTGVPPFHGASTVAVLRQVSDHEPKPVRSLNPDMPAWLEALIARLMAKDPRERFQSAAEVAVLLEGYLAHLRQPLTAPAPELPHSACSDDNQAILEGGNKPARWLPRPLGLVLLALLAVFGLWKVPLLQNDPPTQRPLPKEFAIDFRGAKFPPSELKWTGGAEEATIEPEERGLRISVPANRNRKDPVGLVLKLAVKGNFEITAGYDIVRADQPKTGGGIGFELYLMTETASKDALAFTRIKRTDGTEVYQCGHMTTMAGKRKYNMNDFSAAGSSGRVRLTRNGAEVVFSVADATGGDFQELWRVELGTEDLTMVRICAYTGHAFESVDVHLVDLKVRSESIDPDPSASGPTAAEGGRKGSGRSWLFTLLFGGLGVTLLLIAAAWVYSRRQRREPADEGASASDTGRAPRVSFVCPACGKTIKARAGLAGKKARCPQCGDAVKVPAPQRGAGAS
jgi:serine/threonine protein kinase